MKDYADQMILTGYNDIKNQFEILEKLRKMWMQLHTFTGREGRDYLEIYSEGREDTFHDDWSVEGEARIYVSAGVYEEMMIRKPEDMSIKDYADQLLRNGMWYRLNQREILYKLDHIWEEVWEYVPEEKKRLAREWVRMREILFPGSRKKAEQEREVEKHGSGKSDL